MYSWERWARLAAFYIRIRLFIGKTTAAYFIMSFNAKNLSYGRIYLSGISASILLTEIAEAKEPSFLRKLREENGGGSLRHERPLARPKKQRAGDDDDDEPTYVDEESQDTISRAEYESLIGHQTSSDKEHVNPELKGMELKQPSIAGEEAEEEKNNAKPVRPKQQIAAIGVQKRRKAVKVIGDDTQDHMETGNKAVSTESRAHQKPNKRKKVKLSFDEDADG